MAKTNSKKVMLADDLERIVAGVVSEKTKEYLNNGYILADFKEFQSDRTFKVLLFDDLNPENDFQVILVETNYVYRLEDTTLFKGFISTSKFTKIFVGTLTRETGKNISFIDDYFTKSDKTEIYSTICLDGKVLISFDEAREVANKRAARYEMTINWRDDYHFDIPKSKRGSIFGKNDITAVRYKRMSFPDIKIKYSPFYYVIDENSNRRRVDLSPFDKK